MPAESIPREALLRRSWLRACASLRVQINTDAIFQKLKESYQASHRKYHSLQHLSECIAVLEGALDLPNDPAALELALWFHDAVYDPQAKDNEARSAAWAERVGRDMGISSAQLERVQSLTLATAHSALPHDIDQQIIVDIDLAIFAAPEPRFLEYENQIRQEYLVFEETLYREKRVEVLEAFLSRQFIYNIPRFRAAWEQIARTQLMEAVRRQRSV